MAQGMSAAFLRAPILCAFPAPALLAACVAPVVKSAEAPPSEAAECPMLVRYHPDRAQGDAAAALARGERHLLGVYGYTIEVPGGTYSPTVRMIEGTSDSHCSHLNARARDYARRFNERMAKLVKHAPVQKTK
jgi:hypothetical protein